MLHAPVGSCRSPNRDLYLRLVLPTILDTLKVTVEETFLHRHVFRQVEAFKMGFYMGRQPCVSGCGSQKSFNIAPEMLSGATPVRRRQDRDGDAAEIRRALAVPLVIKYVFQDFVGKCRTIAFKHLRTERRAVWIFAAF